MRFKGLGTRDKLLNMDKDAFNELTLEEQRKVFIKAPQALSKSLYIKLYEGKTVQIITSRIIRGISSRKDDQIIAFMRQSFMIKDLKPSTEMKEIKYKEDKIKKI